MKIHREAIQQTLATGKTPKRNVDHSLIKKKLESYKKKGTFTDFDLIELNDQEEASNAAQNNLEVVTESAASRAIDVLTSESQRMDEATGAILNSNKTLSGSRAAVNQIQSFSLSLQEILANIRQQRLDLENAEEENIMDISSNIIEDMQDSAVLHDTIHDIMENALIMTDSNADQRMLESLLQQNERSSNELEELKANLTAAAVDTSRGAIPKTYSRRQLDYSVEKPKKNLFGLNLSTTESNLFLEDEPEDMRGTFAETTRREQRRPNSYEADANRNIDPPTRFRGPVRVNPREDGAFYLSPVLEDSW